MLYTLQLGELAPHWRDFAHGALFTIALTLTTTVAGVALGVCGASLRAFGPRWADAIVGAYVEIIRNTPFIVQLFFIFFGLPALGVKLTEAQAAFLAMTINLGAYGVEIVRAGLQASPAGQMEAGLSLGLSRLQILVHILLAPALRRVWPALSSQIVIVMLGSSVVSQISAEDLTYAANLVQSRNFRAFESYLVATLIYLALALALRAALRGLGARLFKGA
ncbi:MAG TPA: amino acid ABC transporter permease [Beijerinckiaceae bacterium]